MKLLMIFTIVSVSAVAPRDNLWMEMFSRDVAAAFEGDTAAEPNVFELTSELGLSVLAKMFSRVNLKDTLRQKGPFTVFGPSNEAFADLPEEFVERLKHNSTLLDEIIRYHVASGTYESGDLKNDLLVKTLNGKSIRINIYDKVVTVAGRKVSLLDQNASNGVVHVIHHVMFPPPGTIAYVLKSDTYLFELGRFVEKAGLMDTLDEEGPFTMFAPDNKAFGRLSKQCLNQLQTDKDLLTKVLTYHVVPFTAFSAGFHPAQFLDTLEGSTVKITKNECNFRVNRVSVVKPDCDVTNGAMHIIDRVLVPADTPGDCGKHSLNYEVRTDDLFW